MKPGIESVMRVLSLRRLPLEDEKQTQNAIAEVFDEHFDCWEREKRIAGGIIDFVVFGEVGVEVKIKGAPREIHRQLERYAQEPALRTLLLVSSKPVSLPATMSGKLVMQFHLGRAWL